MMTEPSEHASQSPLQTYAFVQSLADLVVFFEPHIDLAILARSMSRSLSSYAQSVAEGPEIAFAQRVRADGTGLDALSRALPEGDGRDELVSDVRQLVELVAEITGAEQIGVRVARLIAPLCPRFHVDPVVMRLLLTYAGPGAEWLEEHDVDRRFLGHAAGTKRDEDSGLLRPGAVIRTIQPGHVALFKGKAFPGNEKRGAVHRSPPKTSREASRVLLTIDPLE